MDATLDWAADYYAFKQYRSEYMGARACKSPVNISQFKVISVKSVEGGGEVCLLDDRSQVKVAYLFDHHLDNFMDSARTLVPGSYIEARYLELETPDLIVPFPNEVFPVISLLSSKRLN